MNKKLLSVLLVIISLFALSSCGNKEEGVTGGQPVFGVAIYKYDDTYISTVRQAIEKAATGKAELLINDGKGDQGTQTDQIDLLIQKGVDVLLVNIVDVGASNTVLEKAKQADIPIIFFNREPSTEILKSYDKARFVGTNAKDAGIIQGEIIADTWKNGDFDKNKDGIMQYVMLKGEPDNPEAVLRTEYSIKTAEENGVKTEELGLQIANWDTEQANRTMEAWLSKYGDKIEFAIANNDAMAQGVISALQAAGYNKGDNSKFIPVVGVDATDAAKDLINKGYMTGTVLQDGAAMGEALVDIALNFTEGKEFIEGTDYEYDETGVSVRIPYSPYVGE